MKLKFESPPTLRGREAQQLQSLHAYLCRLSEMLNMALDSPSAAALSASDTQSPRSLFNSLKRLMAASPELIDSYYGEIYSRLQSIFLSISDFRQNSTQVEEKFSETEKKILDSETALMAEMDSLRQTIPAIPQIQEQDGWYLLRRGDFAELWGSVSEPGAVLPLSFDAAIAIPCGTVSGNSLTMPEGSDISAVHIIGKEMQT